MHILADADVVSTFSPYAALGANGVLVALAVWLITKHIPARDTAETLSRERSEEMFSSELRLIREGFERQMDSQRKQSSELAHGGQMAVTALSEAFHELAIAMSTGEPPITKSGVLRRRQQRKDHDSVLE